jgi:hypothetical protein
VVWVEALYQLCTLKQDASYRQLLAEGVIEIENTGLGLPPSVLGADPEAVKITDRVPCPSASDRFLRPVNLSCNGRIECLVINSTDIDRELTWQSNEPLALSWVNANGQSVPAAGSPISIQSKNWIWGRQK